jgi:mannitol/fructose-specific phosphotransferase system IIA component (Ntr-type)
MLLESVITRERIKLGVSGVDKWTLIEDLVDMICAAVDGCDRETLINDTLDREHKGSTGIGEGIAIPHARTAGLPELVGALAVSQDGIDFESSDGKPCHLVFLILAPHEASTKYLKALSAVAAIGKDRDRADRLRYAGTPDEVISILGEVEGGQ